MPAMAPPDRLLPPPPPLEGAAAVAGMVMPPGLKLLRDTLFTSNPAGGSRPLRRCRLMPCVVHAGRSHHGQVSRSILWPELESVWPQWQDLTLTDNARPLRWSYAACRHCPAV